MNQVHQADAPILKDLLLIGGGHSHVAVLKRFAMNPMPGVRVTLISKDVATPYSGMLPGLIAGHYTAAQAHIDVHALCRFAHAQFYHDKVIRLDMAKRQAICGRRPPVAFDLLSLDIGSTPKADAVPGAAQHALPIKPVDRFLSGWTRLIERARKRPGMRIAVAGAGAGGVELTLAAQYRLQQETGMQPEFHLISAAPMVLPSHNERVQAKFSRVLAERQVRTHLDHRITEVTPDTVRCENGREIPFDALFWVTDAGAPSWLRESGLDVDPDGFVRVNAALQSLSHPTVFAAGDIAAVVPHPRPKAGVFAVRQGPPLTRNLRLALTGQAPKPFRPQKEFLSLISTGNQYAVASRGSWAAEGRRIWRWKDWIDRRWMRQYQELPEMPQQGQTAAGLADATASNTLSATYMRCGGCGAKIGSQVLHRVLARLDPGHREDVLVDLTSADDATVSLVPPGKVSVQSVDFFRAFINDPYRLGQIAANHSLGDLFAMGAQPQSALAVVTLPYAAEDKLEEQLFQLLSGGVDVFRAHQTVLAGGHTAEGHDLAIGFAVQGLADPTHLLRKGGLRPGDQLILTKPLGTGALFAADMRFRARGQWIEAALASMLHSNGPAATCFLAHQASACTDVTGFGLLGHLLEMLDASRADAQLNLEALPILAGAQECLAAGVFSSLHPENLRSRSSIENIEESSRSVRFPLLFDPQTAGGLLAGVPAEQVEPCLVELKRLGYVQATVIGQVLQEGSPLGHPRIRVFPRTDVEPVRNPVFSGN